MVVNETSVWEKYKQNDCRDNCKFFYMRQSIKFGCEKVSNILKVQYNNLKKLVSNCE